MAAYLLQTEVYTSGSIEAQGLCVPCQCWHIEIVLQRRKYCASNYMHSILELKNAEEKEVVRAQWGPAQLERNTLSRLGLHMYPKDASFRKEVFV